MRISKLRKRLNAAALALLLAACGAPPARPPAPAVPAPPVPAVPAPPAVPAAPPAVPRGTPYRIDSLHSELRLLVYRAGVMASLGHDHVIVNRALDGWVSYSGELSSAGFSLTVPTSGFVVDEEAARRQEGEAFSEAIPENARAATLHNMLSPAVLDAQGHPSITVQSVSIEAAPGEVRAPPGDARARSVLASVRVSVAGHESSLVVPFTLETSSRRLHAQAAFTVQQSGLGLTPFSVLLGALRTDDRVRVELDLVAVRD